MDTQVQTLTKKALEYIYDNPKHGALYTIMCDVVAGALDKLRELKERDEKESKPLAFSN